MEHASDAKEVGQLSKLKINKDAFKQVMTRRFFLQRSFQIYGGKLEGGKGLFDFGPPGCAVKSNMLDIWKQHFILEEGMLEVDTVCVTPELVLEASGHKARFHDYMCSDTVNGQWYRADHLLEDHMDFLLSGEDQAGKVTEEMASEYETIKAQADDYSPEELHSLLTRFRIKSRDGNDLTEPKPFNLMFHTDIGPSGSVKGFLRPETAQGIFTNFKALLEYNGGKLPFAGAQIGRAFRNEIAPRNGLLRVREFQMAEIEHFCHPDDKSHPKFKNIQHLEARIYPRTQQLGSHNLLVTTFGYAVEKGIIANETLAYFMARTMLFCYKIGVSAENLRFRQHLPNEMAHYAQDCWDAELLTSMGWVECVGHADRACYDLEQHTKWSGIDLRAYEMYDEPKEEEEVQLTPNKGKIGPAFKRDAGKVLKFLSSLSDELKNELHRDLVENSSKTVTIDGTPFDISKEMVVVKTVKVKKSGYSFFPHTIEPSFGVGRILYALLEQNFLVRPGDDEARTYLSLPACVAPFKVAVLPHMPKENLIAFVPRIVNQLTKYGLASRADTTGSKIGRRYARMDELGVSFAVTIDYTSCDDDTVTLRERDSQQQIRVLIDKLAGLVGDLVAGSRTWAEVYSSGDFATVEESASST